MDNSKEKKLKRKIRHIRVRAKINGTAECPRLSVFKSNRSISAQLIDDSANRTILSAHSREIKAGKAGKDDDMTRGLKMSFEVGKLIAQRAGEKKIKKAVFDKGGFKFHGQIKALADGARAEGLEF